MTKSEFLREKEVLALSKEEVNTNNGWGFGGMVGAVYTFENDFSLRIGRADYRHMKSERFFTFRRGGERLIDRLQAGTNWQKVLDRIREELTNN